MPMMPSKDTVYCEDQIGSGLGYSVDYSLWRWILGGRVEFEVISSESVTSADKWQLRVID